MLVAMSSNPESSVERMYDIFQKFILERFPDCILTHASKPKPKIDTCLFANYTTETLCRECAEVAYTPNHTSHKKFKQEYVLGNTHTQVFTHIKHFVLFMVAQFCTNSHNTETTVAQAPQGKEESIVACWSHNVHIHDIFFSYRVSSEGASHSPNWFSLPFCLFLFIFNI